MHGRWFATSCLIKNFWDLYPGTSYTLRKMVKKGCNIDIMIMKKIFHLYLNIFYCFYFNRFLHGGIFYFWKEKKEDLLLWRNLFFILLLEVVYIKKDVLLRQFSIRDQMTQKVTSIGQHTAFNNEQSP